MMSKPHFTVKEYHGVHEWSSALFEFIYSTIQFNTVGRNGNVSTTCVFGMLECWDGVGTKRLPFAAPVLSPPHIWHQPTYIPLQLRPRLRLRRDKQQIIK